VSIGVAAWEDKCGIWALLRDGDCNDSGAWSEEDEQNVGDGGSSGVGG